MVPRRRAKPLLGTVVEICARCADDSSFVIATDAAFARIAHIHRAMSFHEHMSDLQVIARARAGERVAVDRDTWTVLQLALAIEHESAGIFNPSIAPTLVRSGLLPRPAGRCEPPHQSTLASSIRLDVGHFVHVQRPVWIDLGGIAKGFAVDAATRALIEHGTRGGVVNAGGDLRVFGDVQHTIQLRHPSNPRALLPVATLRELSCATSADYFVANLDAPVNAAQTAMVGARATQAATNAKMCASITVIAEHCAIADALTKVLWLTGIDSAISRQMLAQYDAHAVALDRHGVATYA